MVLALPISKREVPVLQLTPQCSGPGARVARLQAGDRERWVATNQGRVVMSKGHRIVLAVALSGLTAIALAPSVSYSAGSAERKVPYTGPKISSWTLMCKSAHMAAGGFWRDHSDASVTEGARFQKEAKPTHWRVSISKEKGTAEVIRFNENFEELEAPARFSFEITPGGGFLLVKTARDPGTSPEAISIDPLNSSFVYSSQHANVLWNRANIWYGSCKAYQ